MNDFCLTRRRKLLAVAALTLLRKPIPAELWPAVFGLCCSLAFQIDDESLILHLRHLLESKGIDLPRGWPASHQVNRSIRLCEQWQDQGIGLVTSDQIPSSTKRPSDFPPFFFHIGRVELLNCPKIAILNSRKSKNLSPRNRWVWATKGLFSFLDRNGATWISSLGNYPYEMICTLCADQDRPLIVVLNDLLPEMRKKTKETAFYGQYGRMFPAENTLLLSAVAPGRAISGKDRQPLRDVAVAGLADALGVAEIRAGGNMERLALSALDTGKPVTVFQPKVFDRETGGNRQILKRDAESWRLPPSPVGRSSKPVLQSPADFTLHPDVHLDGQFLIHFTRSCPGIWPGQDWFDYYRSIIHDAPEAGHTAFDTLIRILEERKIRAQAGLVRGAASVVSFTAAGIVSARYLMQWRKGLIRWTFEPYGLAIHRRDLSTKGVRPVIYGDERVWRKLPRRERFRFQKHSAPRNTWLKEREWRMAGDLDLTDIDQDRIRVIVCFPGEADTVRDRFGLPVLCLQAPVKPQTIRA